MKENKQNETNNEQKDTNQISNEQNNDMENTNEESKIEEKLKTFWDKIKAFFKNPIVVIVVLVLFVGIKYLKVESRHSRSDYDSATKAYENKDYQTALELYEKVCVNTKVSIMKHDSCYKAGGMYEKGLGTKKNPQKAYRLYSKYCDDDKNPILCNAASVMLYQGRGIKKDLELSLQYIQKAIKLEPEIKTYYYNAAFIARDLGDTSKANEYLKQACKYGESRACNQSFKASQKASNTLIKDKDYNEDMQDIKTIIKDMESSCDNVFNCDNLNDMPQEYQRLKNSCDSGNLNGCNELGHWYFNNSRDDMIRPEIGEKHYKKALKVWDKACKSLYADSCYVIGYTYYNRDDNVTALKYLSKACSLGHSGACDIKEHLSKQGY